MVPPADDAEHGASQPRALNRNEPHQPGVQSESSAEGGIQEKAIESDRGTTEQAPVDNKEGKKKKVGLSEVDGPAIEGAWYVCYASLMNIIN